MVEGAASYRARGHFQRQGHLLVCEQRQIACLFVDLFMMQRRKLLVRKDSAYRKMGLRTHRRLHGAAVANSTLHKNNFIP
jgi:hypothetical protein